MHKEYTIFLWICKALVVFHSVYKHEIQKALYNSLLYISCPVYILYTENLNHSSRSNSSHQGISAVCEGAVLWKSYTKGMSPLYPAMQCKYPAFSKPVPIAEAAQARQHKGQHVTSLETTEETQDKQNLVSSVAVLVSRSP